MSINNGGGGIALQNLGAWNDTDAYAPGNCVTNSGVGYLNYVAISPSTSPPVIDGFSNEQAGVNATSIAGTLTTGHGQDEICALIFIQQQGGGTTVASVADTATLSWSKRWALTGSNIDCELWIAGSTNPLTGDIVTATFSGAAGGNSSASMVLFGVNSQAAWDGNGGLPFHTTGTTTLVVSTSDEPDLAIYVGVNSQDQGVPPVPDGFTNMTSFTNGAGLQDCYVRVATQSLTGTWTGQDVTPGGGSSTLNVVDAITNSGATNPAPGDDPAHWIG
jgi:hypothetical protein